MNFDTETKSLEPVTGAAGNVDCCGDVFSLSDDTLDSREQTACPKETAQPGEAVRACSSTDKDGDSSSSHLIYPIVWLTVGAPLQILQPASSTPHGSQLSVA